VGVMFGLFLISIVVPYFVAWCLTKSGYAWSGLIWKVDDQNVHLAWARQAQEGHFVFTTEGLSSGQHPLFTNALPLLMGLLARFTGLGVIFWYHVIRVAGAFWALWEFRLLSRAVLKDAASRVLALALVAFTSGGSTLALLFPVLKDHFLFVDHPDPGNFPTMPEAFFSLSALCYPLNIVSYGLLILIFRKLITAEEGMRGPDLGVVFISALLLSNIHTYDALPLLVVILVWGAYAAYLKQANTLALCSGAGFGALLPIAYQFFVFRGSEEFRVKALTVTAAPAVQHIFASFWPLIFLAIVGVRVLRGQRSLWLLLLWTVAVFGCIYAPVSFARKMIEGGVVPLCLLGGAGAAALLKPLKDVRSRQFVALAGFTFLALSPLNFVAWCLTNADTNNSERLAVLMPPIYLTSAEWSALGYLNAHMTDDEAVLCLPYIGSYVPRQTGKTAFLGHWAETLYFPEKLGETIRFYKDEMSPNEAAAFLAENHIRYVVVSQYEAAISGPDQLFVNDYGLVPVWAKPGADGGLTQVLEVPGASPPQARRLR